jgi:peptide deformylase
MIVDIVDVKDPVLRKKAKPVKKIDKKIKGIIQDLKDTISAQKDPEGVGLAAPQIGKSFRVFVMKPDKNITTIINPKIIWIKDEKKKEKKLTKKKKDENAKKSKKQEKKEKEEIGIMEGCLSLPHYYGPIEKPNRIKISYINEKDEKVEKIFKDFEAQIIQHEIDHLNGVLFVDRLLEQKRPLFKAVGDEWEKVDIL